MLRQCYIHCMNLIENTRAGFEGRIYRLSEEGRADIREGLAEIERGEVASDKEVEEVFKNCGSNRRTNLAKAKYYRMAVRRRCPVLADTHGVSARVRGYL